MWGRPGHACRSFLVTIRRWQRGWARSLPPDSGLVLDTGGLLAAIDSGRRFHGGAREAIESASGALVVSPFVLAERAARTPVPSSSNWSVNPNARVGAALVSARGDGRK